MQSLDQGHYFGKILTQKSSDKFIISETNYSANTIIPPHYHKNFYICFVMEGHYSEIYLKNKVNCIKGDIIFHPQQLEHSNIFNDNGGICLNIELKDALQKEISELKFSDFKIFDKKMPLLTGMINKIYQEYKADDIFSDIIIEGLVLETIGFTAREIHKDSSHYWFKKANEIIMESHYGKISLSKIAVQLNVTSSHLAREFKRTVGITIGQYIQHIKIKQACEKLKARQEDILSIALQLGFADQSHFTKTFKKVMKISPSKYKAIIK